MSPNDDRRAQAAELFVQHSEELLAFFRAMLPMAKVEARDLLQQTFEQLLEWLAAKPERTIDHGRGLLFTIARRRVFAFRNKRARAPVTDDSETLAAEPTVHEDDVEYLASLHEDRRGVLRAMRRLGARQPEPTVCDPQLLLYLKFFAGMTETQVGDLLGRSRATIAGQLRRARAALEKELEALERIEPGSTRTSTTLLRQWWSEVEALADEMAPDESDTPPPSQKSSAAS
ncbi:MAG: sigma-70 family RNA polymerase sigma factor [Myxococcota bacterium]